MPLTVKPTILMIDDDHNLCAIILDRLKHEGFQVVTFHSAEEGLRHLSKRPVDLIILDINLRGMNGFIFLQQLAAIGKKNIPVLAFTARADLDEIRQRPGVAAVVGKTQGFAALTDAIRRLLEPAAAANPAPEA